MSETLHQREHYPINCPHCLSDLLDPMHEGYSRVIGLYDREKDATTAWRCPDCKYEWER